MRRARRPAYAEGIDRAAAYTAAAGTGEIDLAFLKDLADRWHARPRASLPGLGLDRAHQPARPRARFTQTLQALQAQRCGFRLEVVVVDRVRVMLSAVAQRTSVAMQMQQVTRDAPLPQMWWQALQIARGRVAITRRASCVSAPDWLQQLHDEFAREPALHGRKRLRAQRPDRQCARLGDVPVEYAALAPPSAAHRCARRHERRVSCASGLCGAATTSADHRFLGCHAAAALAPQRAPTHGWRVPACVMHCKHFGVGGFLRQRYTVFAPLRWLALARWPSRGLAALSSPLLPLLLTVRLFRAVAQTRVAFGQRARHAVPGAVFYRVGVGRCVELRLGPADALQRIE